MNNAKQNKAQNQIKATNSTSTKNNSSYSKVMKKKAVNASQKIADSVNQSGNNYFPVLF